MSAKFKVVLNLAKALVYVCRLLKLGGTTLPGKVACKLYPGIIVPASRGFRIIMVTGTNGKTTTSRIIGQILEENGIEYIANKSGANLLSGVTTTFISNVGLDGRSSVGTALIEIDEAAFNSLCDYIEPDILVVTNFFRDQLDRYGELYTTLKNVRSGIDKLKNTKLILNADDSLCASLGVNSDKTVLYYGFSEGIVKGYEEALNSDAMFCIFCKSKYIYTNRIYAHLGSFSCPSCGYAKPVPHVACKEIIELKSSWTKILLSVPAFKGGESSYVARINLPGLYNVYNSLAGAALGNLLEFPMKSIIKALDNFECGFGRMETIKAGEKFIKLILVKNPTGFNQVLNFLLEEEEQMNIAFLINDNYADGTDISWLWDVDFEKLHQVKDRIGCMYTSGIRAEDMALRLKYAGFYTDRIHIAKDYRELIDRGLSVTKEGNSFYMLPTYTAMFEIRKQLKNKFRLKEFWK